MSLLFDTFRAGGVTRSRKILEYQAATGNSAVVEVVDAGGGFQVSGVFAATVTFEQSANGTSGWSALTVYPDGASAGVTTATAPGIFGFAKDEGFVRARVSSYTSGAVNIRYVDLAANEVPGAVLAMIEELLATGKFDPITLPAATVDDVGAVLMGEAVADVAALTAVETAGGSYTSNEQDLLTHLTDDVTELRTALVALKASLESSGVLDTPA